MATWDGIAPSAVKATILDSRFKNGDVIKVVATPTDKVIDWGMTGGTNNIGFTPNKYFDLICEQDPVYEPDPMGMAAIGRAPVIHKARAVSPVTCVGIFNQYGINSGSWTFKNFNVSPMREPDWLGAGETWASLGYRAAAAMMTFRPSLDAQSDIHVQLEEVHFEGLRDLTPTASDGFGDCPTTYYSNSSSTSDYYGCCYADGRQDAARGFTNLFTNGRGILAPETDYRNKKYVAALGADILYNDRVGLPGGLEILRVRSGYIKNCSFRNLGAGFVSDPAAGLSMDFYEELSWYENLYNDWLHMSGSGSSTEAQTRDQLWRSLAVIKTGAGGISASDLGYPHVDFQQFFNGAAPGPRLLVKSFFNDAGAQAGKPNRDSMQNHFSGGSGPSSQVKFLDAIMAAAQNKVSDLSPGSGHYERVQGLWVPTAPGVLARTSANVPPVAAGALFQVTKPTVGIASRGLVKDCVAGSFNFKNGAAPKQVNNRTAPQGTGANIPVTIAPDGNTASASIAQSYAKYKSSDDKRASIVEFLASARDFANFSVHSEPPTVEGLEVNSVVQSPLEGIHCGDFNAPGVIEIVTPGLQWQELNYDGSAILQAFRADAGTVTDGNKLQLQATTDPNYATPKDYFYKLNGQLQKWTVVTKSGWKTPSISKAEIGQFQRRNNIQPAIIPGATAAQNQKGIIWLRLAVSKPSTAPLTSAAFLGTSRMLQCKINATTGSTYTLDLQFANSTGGRVGTISSGNLTYDVVYDIFYQVDFTIAANNCGIIIHNSATGAVVKGWTTATQAAGAVIAWDYAHADNGLTFANGIPMSAFGACCVWAGQSLVADDGSGTATNVLVNPGQITPERVGYRGTGLTGARPQIFLLGEPVLTNRGSDPNAWSSTAALADVGGVSWANSPGIGPKLSLGWDNLPPIVTEGDVIALTLKTFGSNEPFTATLSLPVGVALVGGGNTIAFAENEQSKVVQLVMSQRGVKAIGVTNNVGYNSPNILPAAVGVAISLLVEPDPTAGFAGDQHLVSTRFDP